MDQPAGSLHADGAPAWSQTRTFQKALSTARERTPAYSIWFWRLLIVFPVSQRSALSAARLAGVLATSI